MLLNACLDELKSMSSIFDQDLLIKSLRLTLLLDERELITEAF